MDRELYSIERLSRRGRCWGGIARNTLYDLLRSGALASVPIGRRRFISARAIAAFIAESSTTEGPEGAGGGRGHADGAGAVGHSARATLISAQARVPTAGAGGLSGSGCGLGFRWARR